MAMQQQQQIKREEDSETSPSPSPSPAPCSPIDLTTYVYDESLDPHGYEAERLLRVKPPPLLVDEYPNIPKIEFPPPGVRVVRTRPPNGQSADGMGMGRPMEGDGNGKRPCLSLLTTTPLASTSNATSPLSSATTASTTRSPRSPSPPAAIMPPGLYVSSQLRVREPVLPDPAPAPVPRVPVPSNALPANSRYSTRLFVAPGPTATPTNAPQPHPTSSSASASTPTPTPHRHPHAPVKSVAPSRWRWHSILPPLDTGFDFRGQLTSASARGSPVEAVEVEEEQEQGGDVMVEVRDETPTVLVTPAREYGAVAYEQGCWSQSQTGASGYQMTQTQWYHGHSTYVAYPGQQHQPEPVYHSPVSASSPTVSAEQHEQPTYNTHYPSQAFRYPEAYSPVPAPAPAAVDSHPQPQPQPHFNAAPLSPRAREVSVSGVTRSLPHAHAPHHHPYGYARGLPMSRQLQDAEGMGSHQVVPMYAPAPVRPNGYSVPDDDDVEVDCEPLPPPPPPPPTAQNQYHHPAAAYDEYAYYAQQEQEHVDTPPSTSSSSGSSVASSETESPQTPYVYPAYAQAQRYPLAFAQQDYDDGPEAEEAQARYTFYDSTAQAYYYTDPNASPVSPSYEYGHGYAYASGGYGYGYGCAEAEGKQYDSVLYEPRQVQVPYQRLPSAESEYLAQFIHLPCNNVCFDDT
ncbi:hypothetical protein C8F01DRAFT_1067269 [Mycena amicta]|nr:hypothetical protein C8F01DRAFT_1067269 [Mycena amicta]